MASTAMEPRTAELYDRINALFATRDVHPLHRTRIRGAFQPGAAFETLQADVQQIITANEARPQTSGWQDPADVPDWVFDGSEPPGLDAVPDWVLDGADPPTAN